MTTADVCCTDSETAEPFAGWTSSDVQGLAHKRDDLLLQWCGLKVFSVKVVPADTLQQLSTPGLVAHSAPSPDVSCLPEGPEVNCSVSLIVGQCIGARLGEHFEVGNDLQFSFY